MGENGEREAAKNPGETTSDFTGQAQRKKARRFTIKGLRN
jgi:hypothetical protein